MVIRINIISVRGLIQTKPWKSTIILWWSRCCRTNEYSIYLLVLWKSGLLNKIYFHIFLKHKIFELFTECFRIFWAWASYPFDYLVHNWIWSRRFFIYFTEVWFKIAPFDLFALRWNLDVSHALKNPGQSTASHRIDPNKISAGKPRNKNIRLVSSKRIASNDVWSLVPSPLKNDLKYNEYHNLWSISAGIQTSHDWVGWDHHNCVQLSCQSKSNEVSPES